MEASHAYTRLWPSGANFNRSFPGSPDGPLDEQLADFITRFLIAEADIVVDMHSGGRSSLFGAWSEMHWVDDPEQRRQMVDGDARVEHRLHFVYIDVAGTGLLVGEAERQGKIVVATELGGGGHVLASTHRIAIDGLAQRAAPLRRARGRGRRRASRSASSRAVIVRATDDGQLPLRAGRRATGRRSSTSATASRRASSSAASTSSTAPTASRRPSHAATTASSASCARSRPTEPGDNVLVIGREIDVAELA